MLVYISLGHWMYTSVLPKGVHIHAPVKSIICMSIKFFLTNIFSVRVLRCQNTMSEISPVVTAPYYISPDVVIWVATI